MDELRSISIFAKTVELGSFRAAAKEFNLSPSVVSYHISQLEERYNIALLYRSTRKLSLTDEGRQLYEHAKIISGAAADCFNILARESTSPSGKLTISVPGVLTRSKLSKQIALFSKAYPKVKLCITYTDVREDLIANGIDIGIRIGVMPDSRLKSKRITSLRRKLVCSADYYHTKPKPESPKELNEWNWINLTMLPSSRSFRNSKGDLVETENQSSVDVNSVDATCQLSIHGLGLSSPPDFMVDKKIEQGDLIHVLPEWKIDDIPVYAVWPQNVKQESIASLFVSLLTKTL